MGHRDWHVARAKHNKRAADSFLDEYADWACTALFYSAYHYVQSALADEADLHKDERHPRKHTGFEHDSRGMNQLVAAVYPSINRSYKSLYDLSRRTRYDVDMLNKSITKSGLDDRMAFVLATVQWQEVRDFCLTRNKDRPALKARDV